MSNLKKCFLEFGESFRYRGNNPKYKGKLPKLIYYYDENDEVLEFFYYPNECSYYIRDIKTFTFKNMIERIIAE